MNELWLGDCLEAMNEIDHNTVDLLYCDLPYGTTQCKWDTVIDLDKWWALVWKVCKPNAAVVLHSAQPFTATLVNSQIKYFKYDWVWEKSKATNYLNAKKQPLRAHESICVFYKKPPVYNPQMTQGTAYNKGTAKRETDVYGKQVAVEVKSEGQRYPRSVQYFVTAESEGKLHPTQKPIALAEYIIKTYTNEGDVMCDPTMGSATACLAARNLNRDYIGIELEEEYFFIAEQRLHAKSQIPNK
jgi:site-specific DNA-methyltransferase (adenine-specific)